MDHDLTVIFRPIPYPAWTFPGHFFQRIDRWSLASLSAVTAPLSFLLRRAETALVAIGGITCDCCKTAFFYKEYLPPGTPGITP
jgi:hypothetical protein